MASAPEYREANDSSIYTVQAHVRYLAEVATGRDLEVRSETIGATGKSLWIWHELWVEGRLRATEEVLGVHVTAGAASPFAAEVAAAVQAAVVEPPEHASGQIKLRRP